MKKTRFSNLNISLFPVYLKLLRFEIDLWPPCGLSLYPPHVHLNAQTFL